MTRRAGLRSRGRGALNWGRRDIPTRTHIERLSQQYDAAVEEADAMEASPMFGPAAVARARSKVNRLRLQLQRAEREQALES